MMLVRSLSHRLWPTPIPRKQERPCSFYTMDFAFPDVRLLNLIRLDVASGAVRRPMGEFQRLIFPQEYTAYTLWTSGVQGASPSSIRRYCWSSNSTGELRLLRRW